MKKVLKFFLYLLIWLLITGVIVLVTTLLELPLQTGLQIAVTLFGIWFAFIIIRKLIARYKAKKQVQNLIEQEEKEKISPLAKFKNLRHTSYVDQQFQEVQKILSKSALKKQGDPLYVLPWFVMIGPSNAGKSHSLIKAQLPAPIFEKSVTQESGCSWYPYNQGIIIDTPGEFVDQNNVSGKKEWSTFLKVIEKKRRKEPLNGVILAIDVDRLLSLDEQELFEEGRVIQARLDELMKSLKVKLPIYLLITKCDQLQGFSEFIETLPQSATQEVMGFSQVGDDLKAEDFVPKALGRIIEKIKDLLVPGIGSPNVTEALLQLPKDFAKLAEKIQIFTSGAFQENPFQERPFLRGVYFSALRESEKETEGLFLHDLYTKVLPADRSMLSMLSNVQKAEVITRRLLMAGWNIFVAILITVLYWEYSRNIDYMRTVTQQNAGSFVKKETLEGNVDSLDRLRKMISGVQFEISQWSIPWFNWKAPNFITKMQSIYTERFRSTLMNPLDEQANVALLRAERAMFEEGLSEIEINRDIARQVDTFVRRINILDGYLSGDDLDDLRERPAPFAEGGLYFKSGTNAEFLSSFNDLYLQTLVWPNEQQLLIEERDLLRQSLNEKLAKTSEDLQWIIPLANEEVPEDEKFELKSYWVGSGSLKPPINIPLAYTLGGKEYVEGFVNRLVSTDPLSEEFQKMQQLFNTAYRKAYLETWENFALNFDQGSTFLRGRSEWVDTMDVLSTRHNPYFKALNTFAEQLFPWTEDGKEVPEWLLLMMFYQQMREFGPDDGGDNSQQQKTLTKLALKAVGSLGPVGKAIAKSGKKGLKTQKKLAKGAKTADDRDLVLEDAGKSFVEYRKALSEITLNGNKRAVSMRAMTAYFSNPEELGAGDGPDARAYQEILKLQTMIGKNNRATRAFWELYSGPMEIVTEYMLNESSCLVQARWRQAFLVEIEGVPKYKLGGLMFSPEGQLWSFINQNVSAFIVREYRKGYVPRVVRERKMPFTRSFINFVSTGERVRRGNPPPGRLSVPNVISRCWR